MTDIPTLKVTNARRWMAMHVTPSHISVVDVISGRLVTPQAKQHYQNVSGVTKVPWWVIAVIHERESSQSWMASLAQGDPWNQVSVHIPRGIGPFASWEAAAIYALSDCAPLAARWNDWSIGGSLTLLEEYNGLGYAARGVPSPYIWAATDQYRSGKYIADGHYDPNAVDSQIGCAALISRMMVVDKSIAFAGD